MRQRCALVSLLLLLSLLVSRSSFAVLLGDANEDGRLSVPDVTVLLQVLSGATVGNIEADVNGDGFITADDLDALQAALFGETVAPPSPTVTPPPSPSATAPPTPTRSVPPSASPSQTQPLATASASATPVLTSTATRTGTPIPTASPTSSPTLPASPTASRTPTQTTVAATASATPTRSATVNPGVSRAVTRGAALIAQGLEVIPSVVTAIITGLQAKGAPPSAFASLSAASDGGSGAGTKTASCPAGGQVTRVCSGSLNVTFQITLSACAVDTADGSATFDGTVTVTGPGLCDNVILPPFNAAVNLTGTFKDSLGQTRLTTEVHLTATVSNPQLGGSCFLTGASLALTGTVQAQIPGDSGVLVTFTTTNVVLDVSAFTNANDCVPLTFSLTFNELANIKELGSGQAFDLQFIDFVMHEDASGGTTLVRLDGNIIAACFGGTVTVATITPLLTQSGSLCFSDGAIQITSSSGQAKIFYLSGGAVQIDADLDGTVDESYLSCLAPALPLCVSAVTPTSTASSGATTSTPTRTPTLPTASTATATPTSSVAIVSPTPSATGSAVPFSPSPSATKTRTPTRTATPNPSLSPTPTSTPPQVVHTYCDTLPLQLIPDGDPAGITNTIVVPDAFTIGDIDISLGIGHTWVGDLTVSLQHQESGHTAVLLQRPGISLSQNGCSQADVLCTFDDAALDAAENQCSSTSPAIGGQVAPGSPLSVFNGENIGGSWRLTLVDSVAQQESGALFGWCIYARAPSNAPTVTSFTCEGGAQCQVALDQSFALSFSFTDANGDATSWRLTSIRDDGIVFDLASGTFAPPASSGTIPLESGGFTCPLGGCRTTMYQYVLVVSDANGFSSAPASISITVDTGL